MKKEDIKNLIKELIEKTTASVKSISIKDEGKNAWFEVEVEQPHLFLSRGGEALYALNHLARKIVEGTIPEGEDSKEVLGFLIDINGFQKKRVENIKAVAHMMAERARYFKSNIEVDPMTAYERRIVHEFLSDAEDLKTESEGVGPSRRVVIKYIGSFS